MNSESDDLHDLFGYRVRGRSGDLGIVVEEQWSLRDDIDLELVVRGGVTGALVYLVPRRAVLDVSDERRTVTVDADAADFVPALRDDATVVLDLKS